MLARRRTSSRGSVTAEVALALPGVIIAAYLMMLGLVVVGQQVRCQSAASAVARAVARFESPAAVDRLARQTMPAGAQWVSSGSDELVTVIVTWKLPATSLGRWFPTVRARAVAPVEQ
jgi:hypothetical protein